MLSRVCCLHCRCENRTVCTVEAANGAFEDSCPNVGKYLEVQYYCVLPAGSGAATLVYSTESPPGVFFSCCFGLVWGTPWWWESTCMMLGVWLWRLFGAVGRSDVQCILLSDPTASSSSLIDVTTPVPSAISTATVQSATIQQILKRPSFCPEVERRGLKWPSTRVNNPAKLPCPNNADGE